MALQFTQMTPAGKFSDPCTVPAIDLRPLCPDEVLRNLPRFLGRWEDDQTMPIVLDNRWDYTDADGECDPTIATGETLECKVVLPNQRLVSIGFEELPYRKTLEKFCKPYGLVNFPTLFNADGSFNEGNELSDEFLAFILAELKSAFMQRLTWSAWHGSQDDVHQFDGLLTQLTNGPRSAGDGCDSYLPVHLDWETLTGAAAPAHPSATIAAGGDAVTIHGQVFEGMTGLNAVEFLRLWLERLMEYDLARWGDENVEFELWVGRGQTSCIAELAACMQPCDYDQPMDDPMIRDRAATFRRDKRIYLYPYDNVSITLRQSPALRDRMIFVPKSIGGRPLVGWVFRNQAEEQAVLQGELPWYGSQVGLPMDTQLYPNELLNVSPEEFFNSAFSLHLQRNRNCIEVFINADTAMLIFGFNYWLMLDGITCTGLIPVECAAGMSLPVTECAAVDGQTDQLALTVTGLGAEDPGTADGDTWLVTFADGYTSLIGTVTASGAGSLTLLFGMDVTCETGGGPASVALISG
jgi:hypothetical protein